MSQTCLGSCKNPISHVRLVLLNTKGERGLIEDLYCTDCLLALSSILTQRYTDSNLPCYLLEPR